MSTATGYFMYNKSVLIWRLSLLMQQRKFLPDKFSDVIPLFSLMASAKHLIPTPAKWLSAIFWQQSFNLKRIIRKHSPSISSDVKLLTNGYLQFSGEINKMEMHN